MFRAVKVLALIVGLTFAFTLTAPAQATTAGVTGRVLDSQGNVVPGAKVTAKHRGTGAERSVISNSDGEFVITELPPGRYDLSSEAQTFSRSLIEDFELNVGTRYTVNFDMKPGNVAETVTVTMDVPLVETTKSEIGHTVTPNEISNLPLLNRTFASLTVVAPEARPVGNFDPTKTRIGNVAFNGGDGRSINVNVDGGDNKDNVVGSLLQNFSYESIQEFQIQQHRWGADQGRAVGGVVNVITKSGGNSLRGSFFANFRDDSWTSSTFFDELIRETNPTFEKLEFNRQEYGGSIGGPIQKDKLFYFFALERFRERGFLSVLPSVQTELSLIPGNNMVPFISTPYDDTLLSAKVDHKLTSNQSMFYRFSYQGNESPNDQVATPNPRTDLTGGNVTTNKLYSLVANHTYNITPTTLNQFTFHFQDFKNEILPAQEGLTLNYPTGISIGQNANTPQATEERKFQFRDDISMIKGDHSLKFGVNYIHTILGGYFYFGTRGYSVTFNATPSAIMNGGGYNRDNLVSALTYSDGASSHDQKLDQLAFYAQDDWKIRPNFTLNIGLRWDANFGNLPPQDQNRTILLLSQLNHPLAQAITGDGDALRRTTPSLTEWQPRIGFAWDPWNDSRTVIRGGYGIFYDQIFQNLSLFSAVQSQPQVFQTALSFSNNGTDPASYLYQFRYGFSPLPTVPAGTNYSQLVQGSLGRINDPTAKEPYIQKFSIGFQRELTSNLSISSDYVHTLGLQEPRFLNINPLMSNVCNALYGGNPANPGCVRGASTRVLDAAFVAAGMPTTAPPGCATVSCRIARLEQINMFSTNNRSLFDSWTTTVKYRTKNMIMNASYVLASNRSWGGQPVASYSGNGIAVTQDTQFRPEEFGPTRLDERHRIVLSGVFDLPGGFQIAPVLQYASARPYSPTAGVDIDGDGLTTVDRLCAGVNPIDVYHAVRNRPLVPNTAPGAPPGSMVLQTPANAVLALNPRGCTQADVNGFRTGVIIDGAGNIVSDGNGRYFNVDLRVGKNFRFGERFGLNTYFDFYNIFNTANLAFSQRLAISPATGAGNTARGPSSGFAGAAQVSSSFLTPFSLFGPGFGPPVGRPFTLQMGARFTF